PRCRHRGARGPRPGRGDSAADDWFADLAHRRRRSVRGGRAVAPRVVPAGCGRGRHGLRRAPAVAVAGRARDSCRPVTAQLAAMTVGELSRRTGVPVKALRDYTDWGLIETLGRSPGNYRLYTPDSLWCVGAITELRGLGLTLAEIRDAAQVAG